jgi:hypothetical protein
MVKIRRLIGLLVTHNGNLILKLDYPKAVPLAGKQSRLSRHCLKEETISISSCTFGDIHGSVGVLD